MPEMDPGASYHKPGANLAKNMERGNTSGGLGRLSTGMRCMGSMADEPGAGKHGMGNRGPLFSL